MDPCAHVMGDIPGIGVVFADLLRVRENTKYARWALQILYLCWMKI